MAGIVTKFTLKTYPIPPMVCLSPLGRSSTNTCLGLGRNENLFWPRCLSTPKRYTELYPEQQWPKSGCNCDRFSSYREPGRALRSVLLLRRPHATSRDFRWVWCHCSDSGSSINPKLRRYSMVTVWVFIQVSLTFVLGEYQRSIQYLRSSLYLQGK